MLEALQLYRGRVVSDNGREFKTELFQASLNMSNVRFGYTTPYHPQSSPVARVPQREQHPRLQRGRYNTPAYRYPPPSVYIAPHGHQNNRSLTTLRVCFFGLYLRRYATLRVGGSILKKSIFQRETLNFDFQSNIFFGGRRETFFVSAKGHRGHSTLAHRGPPRSNPQTEH